MSRLLSTLHFLLFFPLRLSYGVLNRIFPFFSAWLPLSWANRLSIGGGRPVHATDPTSVADRWVRQLEEETGAICESRVDVGASSGTTTGAAAGAGPGPNTMSSRRSAMSKAAGQRALPDFFMGSYESALRVAEKEMRPMCVVLVSEEHDDVADFKRLTLVDEDFNRLLRENDFVVWGGDVRDYEASQASQKLGATTYPFVAFVALQPRGGRSATSSTLTVLSRHQGPAVPRSPQSSTSSTSSNASLVPTAASTLTNHLTNTLLPRVTPHLTRLRNAASERALAARLIAEQNAAFEASAERDRERIEMAAIAKSEREEAERRRKSEEEDRQRREVDERAKREREKADRMLWWRYARRRLLVSEPSVSSSGGEKPIRIALRLPSGTRAIRQFSPSTPVTQLYITAASHLIPQEYSPSDDPSDPPSTFAHIQTAEAVESKCWNFTLATAYPRMIISGIPGDGKPKIGDILGIRNGGVVVVEMQEDVVTTSNGEKGNDSDGYETEED